MLIEFSLENYRSIAERQTLSMVATAHKTKLENNTFKVPLSEKLRLLKSAVIYGPNASGKTNILRGLYVLKDIIMTSASQRQANDKLRVEPFRLDSQFIDKPTSFEIIFIQDNIRYQYFLSLDINRIYEESLIAYPKGRAQCWYTREYDAENNNYNWYFGPKLKGDKAIIKNFVRPNSLFLSHATQNNHQQLTSVFNWFREKIYILDLDSNIPGFSGTYTASMCNTNPENINLVIQFLAAADIDIYNVKIKTRKLEEAIEIDSSNRKESESNLRDILDRVSTTYLVEKELKVYSVITLRKMNDSENLVEFSIRDESDGTQRLFSIIGPCLDALTKGKIIIIDELSRSFHPSLSMLIANTFNQKANDNSAQLLFTTHDTTLLDKTIFRRDQIWFTEKNDNRATELYPLIDFKPCKNESLQKGYLQGRYGAIPFTGKLQF